MQRRLLPLIWASSLLLMLAQVAAAHAATYVVAPFKVNGPSGYSYLENAIPPMLSSRLFWDGHFEPVADQDAAAQGQAPQSSDAAARLLTRHNADYVIWGSITILGDEASLDARVTGTDGKAWQQAMQSPVNNLIGGLQTMADAINTEVFGRPTSGGRSGTRVVGPMNPEFMVNESQADTVYLNPQIRYQGMETDRVRSQRLDIESRGMAVADITGDGRNEILLLDENYLYAYAMRDGRMDLLGRYRFASMLLPIQVRHVRYSGRNLIVVSCYDTSSRDGTSLVLSFVNNEFYEVAKRLPFYTNVVALPPMYDPTLIGQATDRGRIVRGPVFEVQIQGDTFTRGANVSNLPKEANVFNFVWVPGNSTSGGDYLAVLNEYENLLTFDSSGRRLAKSDDRFSGGSVGIMHDTAMPGLGARDDEIQQTYYVPMRMLVTDLDRDGRYELILNKPISTAGQLFNNYRTYPQGEIHALMWDGLGMDLIWKTRRIRGTVVDISIADADNDGVLDLVVNVNTYPGTFGVGKVRSLVMLYPLDLNQTNPNTLIRPDF